MAYMCMHININVPAVRKMIAIYPLAIPRKTALQFI